VAALWLRRADDKPGAITKSRCALGLFLAGVASLTAGLVWNLSFPMNKNLWTSSFALFANGVAPVGLAACYWLIDVLGLHETTAGKWLTWPWLVFGSNAIVAYAASELIVELMVWIKFEDGERAVTTWSWLYHHLLARSRSTDLTSVLFALAFVATCFLLNWLLWRKRIFVRI
jgi:predicted acyltransferase